MNTFAWRLRHNYEESPHQIILRLLFNHQPDQVISYTDLLQGSAGYAQALKEAGIRPGEVVILILEHGASLIYSFFGAILHGAVPTIMPFLTEKLSPDQYRRSLAALFQITAPAAVITYPAFEREVLQTIASTDGSFPSLRCTLMDAGISPARQIDFNQLDGFQSRVDDIVLLQHSSGTTGLQKGVALSHQAVMKQLESYSRAIHLSSEDVIVSWLPLYHDMGLIAGFIMPILQKIPLVLLSPFDWVRAPYKLLQAVSQFSGSLTWLPNFAYNFLALKTRDRDLEGVDLSSWRAVINCSEPMHWKSHQLFQERFSAYHLKSDALATCYAMAENVFAVSQGGISEPVSQDRIDQKVFFDAHIAEPAHDSQPSLVMLSAGKPIPNTQVRVLDDQRRQLPDRHIGEIAIQSDCMLSGYYHREDATQRSFHDGWYLTGDLGYLADGEVYITGRKKDLIIVGGKNVYPQDLENLAGEVTGVYPGRVVAFGVFNESSGTEDVVIIAELDSEALQLPADETMDEEQPSQAANQVADEIRQRVTRGSDITLRYVKMVPRGWLLKTSSGKIARSANRDKYLKLVER